MKRRTLLVSISLLLVVGTLTVVGSPLRHWTTERAIGPSRERAALGTVPAQSNFKTNLKGHSAPQIFAKPPGAYSKTARFSAANNQSVPVVDSAKVSLSGRSYRVRDDLTALRSSEASQISLSAEKKFSAVWIVRRADLPESFSATTAEVVQDAETGELGYLPGNLVIRSKQDISLLAERIAQEHGLELISVHPKLGVSVLKAPAQRDLFELAGQVASVPGILSAEPELIDQVWRRQ